MERRKSSITTKTGDRGTTRLYSGEEVSKHSTRVDALGAVDETVSCLGLARALAGHEATRTALRDIQRDLFVIGSEMATSTDAADILTHRVDDAMIGELDARREALESSSPPPGGFIVPGASPAAAAIDLGRSVARRLERSAARLSDEGLLSNPRVLVWLNRLSDVLWLLARTEESDPDLLNA